jgi:hypothetical protein
MVKLARPVRMRLPAVGAAALLAASALAACGGSGSGGSAGSTGSGSGSASTSATRSTSTGSGTSPAPAQGTLTLSPARPTTRSELTFGFTAPVAAGVHGSHVIYYDLSLVGPTGTGCVGAHEAGASSVGRGVRAQIVVGPAELHAPWCQGRYLARVLELRRAHCTGSRPCPQYVAVAGVVGRLTFTIRG